MPGYWFYGSCESCNRFVSSRLQLQLPFTLRLDIQYGLLSIFLNCFHCNVLFFFTLPMVPQSPVLIDLTSLWDKNIKYKSSAAWLLINYAAFIVIPCCLVRELFKSPYLALYVSKHSSQLGERNKGRVASDVLSSCILDMFFFPCWPCL